MSQGNQTYDITRVDDLLIEMIQPKITEIETKFSQGKGLTQDDINTLLLKSQYNHINHLDGKLNEVTASVVALEAKFGYLENKFLVLEEKVEKTIQKALNKNMVMLVVVLGLFLTLFKILDAFLPLR